MNRLLWQPSEETKNRANMTRFMRFVNERYRLSCSEYDELYRWSIENIPELWAAVWDFTGIEASRGYDRVVDDLGKFPGAMWFEGARLNFARNLLRYSDDHPALIFKGEGDLAASMTYAELHGAVARLAKSLRAMGVKPSDRVVAYMPNLMETVIAMLAATSIGAIWSSCATDLGVNAVLDRFGQIEPRVLFTVDGYLYKGKAFSSLENAGAIARGLPSLRKVIVIRYLGTKADIGQIPHAVFWDDFMEGGVAPGIDFEQLPFSHPAVVMFSSGTTGKPKCIVQSAGGLLLNQRKELMLHADLKREDRIMYMTTCSWMMWNWMVSALGIGATVVLYEGNAMHPDEYAMFRLIENEKISVFGTSATFINQCRRQGLEPGERFDLSSLREMCQTGSPLSAEGFEYVYRAIKRDLHFNSISGGTDINGCFAIGCPLVPVLAGELQRWGLGMKMKCYSAEGRPVADEVGELVCESPAPSMPLYFWNDPDGRKYREAYFGTYPGTWRHGDYVMVHSDTGGITFYGRSDALLKPSGVRIGTAEIYNVIESIEGIADSVAVGQEWKGDQRVILFVKLANGHCLTDDLKRKISTALRERASPRHVPAEIIEVSDIPYTHNGKKVEVAITAVLHGKPVLNRDALANPQSLDHYVGLAAVLQRE
ncbi:MAG: acetoacetate--CoA ligase [Chloroflexi bacterium]|nr:acetoacetate--CoA ligase [Chloroflexota bacterium]